MDDRWYLLLDESTHGVLIGVQDVVIVQQLRQGVLDAKLVRAKASYPGGEQYVGYRKPDFFPLPPEKRSEAFVHKHELLHLRLPAFEEWKGYVFRRLWRDRSFYFDIDDTMARELDASTVEHPSEGLLDYAQMSDLPVREVYEYFKLQTHEHANRRLMLHALAMRYARRINGCKDEGEIEIVRREMKRDFGAR